MATEATAFDLDEFEQTDEATINLQHPVNGDTLKASITIYGTDSAQFKAATTKMRARMTDYMSRNKGASSEQKQSAFDRFERDRNISLIKSIDNLSFKGIAVTDVRDACDKWGWIYTQAVAAMDCTSNFIKDLSPTA
ncbi:MAG: hypothetical protein WCP20_10960 [Desulfuromonadales bacterium]